MNEGEVRGLGEQAGRLRSAGERLLRAHVDLARTELGEIADDVKRLLALAGLALALVLFALLLVAVGLPLFLGDWLFGSLGWGLLDGVLVAIGIAVVAAAAAVGAPSRTLFAAAVAGIVVAIAMGVVLGFDLAFRGSRVVAEWAAVNLGAFPPAGWQNAVSGAVAGAVLGALLLLALRAAWRRSLRGATGWLLGGLVLGALAGLVFGGVHYSKHVAAAIGLTVGLLVWIGWLAAGMTSVDVAHRFERLYPKTTVETARETWEWVRGRIKPASR